MIPRFFGFNSDWSRPTDHVWFSRDIQQGQLQYWMVVVNSLKFKLRRQPNGSYELECYEVDGWSAMDESQRIAKSGRKVLYSDDRWVLTPIGFSHLGQDDIFQHFKAIRADYPLRLSWGQCQDFLRRFVAQVLARRAEDWQWFFDNTDPARTCARQLPTPPARLLAEFEARRAAEAAEKRRIAGASATINGLNANVAMQNQQQLNQFNAGQAMMNGPSYGGFGS